MNDATLRRPTGVFLILTPAFNVFFTLFSAGKPTTLIESLAGSDRDR